MPLFQGFRPVAGTICPSRAAAVVGPSRAPQGMKKGRRPRRRPRLKLSDKAGPDHCPVPGKNALFPAQIAGFLAVSRPVPVYPVFLNYVVPVHIFGQIWYTVNIKYWQTQISVRLAEEQLYRKRHSRRKPVSQSHGPKRRSRRTAAGCQMQITSPLLRAVQAEEGGFFYV